jgi:hypothetical protein
MTKPTNDAPKKRGRKPNPGSVSKDTYFGEREEQTIKVYLNKNTSELQKNELFETIINPCIKKLVEGIMTMPMFQKIIGVNKDQLKEDAYYHLIFQMEKFKPDTIGKSGLPVKAYSYFGTVVKNYILAIKIANDANIANHGGVLDIDEIGDVISDNRRGPNDFNEFKELVVDVLEKAIDVKRLNKNDLIVGNTLKYMLVNWDKLEFQSKNEFIRLLCHYTQLSPPVVARSLKKFKTLAYDTLKVSRTTKLKKITPEFQIESTLSVIISEVFSLSDVNEAREKLIIYLTDTKINIEDKDIMLKTIKSVKNIEDLHAYIANSLLRYEGLSVNKYENEL